MAKNLVLVESPSKAKTINKYLGRNYIVESTVGHIKNLPKTKLGIEVDNGYKVQLLNIRGKGDLIKKIRKLASKSEKIFVATDPDREGEAIAQDVVEILEGKTNAHIYRVLFNEITKNAVKKAMQAPLEIDSKLVESQRARRVMDRIIGYKISPLLWRAILEASGNSLSAGRVQSVALRLICEREEIIESFIPTEYWVISAEFKTENGDTLTVKLAEKEGKQLKVQPKPEMTEKDWESFLTKNFAITNEEDALKILEEIKNSKEFFINDITKKKSKRNPSPPFITSTLQAEASRKLSFRPRKTMRVAQSLYEGIKLGKGEITGLITYMRTDSVRLSDEIVNDAREFISSNYGKDYLPHKSRSFEKKNKKNVQDAHEAIRPTSLAYKPEEIKEYLDSDQFRLYQLIWQRFVACQMEPADVESTNVDLKADKYIMKASGSVITFDGFLKVYNEEKENGSNGNENVQIPAGLEKGQTLTLETIDKNQQFTKPLPRYTESTLIKELENNGIGRPSTYASIIGTIQDRYYIQQQERKLMPTDLGKRVNSVLIKNFPKILDVNFTAKMEEELDLVASGDNQYKQVLDDFYIPFKKRLMEVESKLEKIICEKCGSEMELKIGRFGKFFACSNYPDCKNIKSTNELKVSEPEYTGETCPECGKKTLIRTGKFGKFIGCENYPECNFTKQLTLGIKCPTCNEGEVVTRRSKGGRFFYGCSNYPSCDFVSWNKPQVEKVSEDEE
ncbi:MAG: type I DNA topoisomerase [Ignavibacteriales bacterium]|nr:type I DNA topoisomerase [Ignavibacteriales bacterium]MCB9219004.1 type I DNA topoisomerase [Ignavibacteriales bacterium]